MNLLSSIAIAQIDVLVGDPAGNAGRIRNARMQAKTQGAALVVFPELTLCGYPPEDLILRPGFVNACMEEAAKLALLTADGGPALIIGCPWEQEGEVYNASLVLQGGRVVHIQPKRMLPNYGIFDEKRLFTAGAASRVFRFEDVTIGLLICEDMWYENVAHDLGAAGAELIIAINASPFESGKLAHRREVAQTAVAASGAPLLYVNMVGAQDDIVFDGGSFIMEPGGKLAHQFPEFAECVAMASAAPPHAPLAQEEAVWKALSLGLGDYVAKNRFPGVLLGLSGGIDSALAATLAADTLGKDRVLGVLLPSPYTSAESNDDALALAKNIGIRVVTVPITEMMNAYHAMLAGAMQDAAPACGDWKHNLAVGGNLQARIRAAALMALSNASGYMLLSTGNKSEVATGYTTLYGDSCGGYAPLKDVYKTQVYALAKWWNRLENIIPPASITRPPTAELAPNQKDEDQLPPYAVLDAILLRLVEGRQSLPEIVAAGFDVAVVEKVAAMVRMSEYKRRQLPPGAKVSPMVFGRDWRYPLTSGWKG